MRAVISQSYLRSKKGDVYQLDLIKQSGEQDYRSKEVDVAGGVVAIYWGRNQVDEQLCSKKVFEGIFEDAKRTYNSLLADRIKNGYKKERNKDRVAHFKMQHTYSVGAHPLYV
jgi:hypothetical protein